MIAFSTPALPLLAESVEETAVYSMFQTVPLAAEL